MYVYMQTVLDNVSATWDKFSYIVSLVVLIKIKTHKKTLHIFFKNDDAVNSTDFRGIIMYVWNAETGALEQSLGVYAAGYHNGSDGNQCAVIEDTNHFERMIRGKSWNKFDTSFKELSLLHHITGIPIFIIYGT